MHLFGTDPSMAPATGRSSNEKIPGFASPPRDGFALDGGHHLRAHFAREMRVVRPVRWHHAPEVPSRRTVGSVQRRASRWGGGGAARSGAVTAGAASAAVAAVGVASVRA